jgi:predicted phage terminase large subunit-like protein
MILSGEFKLARKFLMDIKGHFHKSSDTPTRFQQLFPEYILNQDEDEDESPTTSLKLTPLVCPARILVQAGSPSLWVNSIGANLSGWHCDILKGDDVVTDENSNTEDTREKVNEKWTGALNLVDEWGFIDNIGTRYFPTDLFGDRIALASKLPFKFLKRAAWIVKDEYKHIKIEDLEEHMVIMYFPEKLSFASVHAKLLRNKQQALCQQFNEPAGGEDLVHFDEDEMRAAHEQPTAVPLKDPETNKRLNVYVAIDTSSGSNNGDFSAIAGCVFPKRVDGASVMHVIDVAYGKWKNSELARQIVDFAAKWNPLIMLIEDWALSELVKREISQLALQRGIVIPLMWVKRSNEFNAKKNRISGLEILLANQQIRFVNGWWTDELMKQFTRYTGDRVQRRHDDIPDAISYLQKFMPGTEGPKIELPKPEFPIRTMPVAYLFNAPFAAPPPSIESNNPGNSLDEQFFGGQGILR